MLLAVLSHAFLALMAQMAQYVRIVTQCCTRRKCQTHVEHEAIEDVTKELNGLAVDDHIKQNDRYTTIRNLHPIQKDFCLLTRSQATGKLFVIKKAKSDIPKFSDRKDGGRRKSLPTEARMLAHRPSTPGGSTKRDFIGKLRAHPNIITLFTSVRDPAGYRQYKLYFEYCSAGDLLEFLSGLHKKDQLSPKIFTLHVLVSLVYALAYVHHGLRFVEGDRYVKEAGHESIIHGDLKPDNVFLRWPGRREYGMPDVVLADFGMAQVEAESWGVTGTPEYDSPEVLAVTDLLKTNPDAFEEARNARVMTTKSDMYQFGHVIYIMATQHRWKTGRDPQRIELPEEYRDVTGLTAMLVWCLQIDQQDRPECTGDMIDGLLPALDAFRRQRDRLFAEDGPPDEELWNKGEV